MRHQKARNRRAPEEVRRLKRELGLDKQFFHPIRNFVRMEKVDAVGAGPNGGQLVGADETATVTWQESQRNIGGGADVPNNRFIVPDGRTGFWAIRAAIWLSSQTVDPNSNYQVTLTRNGSTFITQSNHSSATRALTARAQDERFLEEGDIIQVQLTNFTDATQPSPGVEILDTSHVTYRFLGFVEE